MAIIIIYSMFVYTYYDMRSEDSFRKLVFAFYSVGPRDGTQVIRLGNMCLYL